MAFCLLYVIRKQWVKQDNYYVDQSSQILCHQYGISVAEAHTFLLAARSKEKRLYSQARQYFTLKKLSRGSSMKKEYISAKFNRTQLWTNFCNRLPCRVYIFAMPAAVRKGLLRTIPILRKCSLFLKGTVIFHCTVIN